MNTEQQSRNQEHGDSLRLRVFVVDWVRSLPRRREAREENAKDFSLVAALLLCVHRRL